MSFIVSVVVSIVLVSVSENEGVFVLVIVGQMLVVPKVANGSLSKKDCGAIIGFAQLAAITVLLQRDAQDDTGYLLYPTFGVNVPDDMLALLI